jgi:peptidoglycan L-alanyl-D-glutamate endopeptidase CwlK
MDKVTLDRIENFHPDFKDKLKLQYETINNQLPKDVRLRFAYTLRTVQEQNELYAQGRTKSGKIITNAKGGQSIHNYGLAFDIVLLYDTDKNGTFETASWEQNKYWMQVVNYFKSKGWEHGGDWKNFKDQPHFQIKKENGESYNWKELSILPKDKSGFPILK